MGFNLWTALRAPFWKVGGFGAGSYAGPALDIAGDNGNQSKVLDPAGQPMNLSMSSGTGRARTHFNNPNGVSVDGQLATAAAPTVTPTGGSGTTWAYKIVARASNGTAAASSAGTTAVGAATLSGTAYNTITWTAVTNAVSYDVYRSTASGTPSTVGVIANVLAGATLSVVDTGLVGDASIAPTVNTTGTMEAISYFDIAVIGLAAVQNTAITTAGTAGSTGYSYKVSSVTATGTENATAAAASTTTGNATLSTTNYNIVTFKVVPGAKTYNIYRTASSGTPGTTGLIGSVTATSSTTTLTFNDTGIAITSATIPTTNTTGSITGATSFSTSGTSTAAQATNYIATESGANNALVAALLNSAGTAITPAAGLVIYLKLGQSLQAGANTLNLNGAGAASIKKASNPATDLSVTAVSGSILMMVFDGTVWQVQGF